ncbi:4'-phosphopantetheinyl transferase [Thermoactinomyces sp. DSM 45891]|uniref:4'-phosphopantetheinyl transferase family protein n=1 Tax=Thermoactinomyces sp. DSM 45891 TaxID=1761907 RepID=UPI000910AC3E|nr:4'-phosphopantetheinyl transferase superfamily protein [Thermoactinomyces sp. DSM 45891]SFX33824.1 4'-phosphopantetheinyl transferase [Thermoactinomyces sp. DSM 45891]
MNNNTVEIYWTKIPSAIHSDELSKFTAILDQKEEEKRNSYLVDHKKKEFLLGRMLLKGLLGQYLGIESADIRFEENKYGKLYLTPNLQDKKQIYFNLTHTDGLVACAVTLAGEVGIDVENIFKDHLEVMPLVFQEEEKAFVKKPEDLETRLQHFYWIWTRKEAVMKAEGKGFSMKPLSFTVPLNHHREFDGEYHFYTFHPKEDCMISTALCSEQGTEPIYEVKEIQYDEICKFEKT